MVLVTEDTNCPNSMTCMICKQLLTRLPSALARINLKSKGIDMEDLPITPARVLGIGALAIAAWQVGACTSSTDDGGIQFDGEHAAQDLPPQFVDVEGRSWVRTRQVDFVPDTGHIPRGDSPAVDFAAMTLEEVTEAFRPYQQYGNYEYTISDKDALAFGREMMEVIAADEPVDGSSSLGMGMGDIEGDDVAVEMDPLIPKSKTVGGESRTDVHSQRADWPYRTVAQMFDAATCTAFKMINHHTAITAAHCVHNGNTGGWLNRKNLRFGGQTATGKDCYGITVPGCWDGDTPSCDYAVIRLHNVSPHYGCSASRYDVGKLGYNSPSSPVSGISAALMGYPSNKMPSGWSYPTLSYEYRSDTGYVSIWYPDRVFYDHDSTGGMSGGPYASFYSSGGWKVRAINRGGFEDIWGSEHQGPRVRSSMINFFNANAGNTH